MTKREKPIPLYILVKLKQVKPMDTYIVEMQ